MDRMRGEGHDEIARPVVGDLDVARQILDDYLTTYREHLPQFW